MASEIYICQLNALQPSIEKTTVWYSRKSTVFVLKKIKFELNFLPFLSCLIMGRCYSLHRSKIGMKIPTSQGHNYN